MSDPLLIVGIAAYGFVALILVRPIAGHLAWAYLASDKRRFSYSKGGLTAPDAWHWFCGTAIAMVAAAAWPVLVVMTVSGHILPKIGAEREAELAQAHKRVAELEREAGIR